ncbi:MAG TPA: CopG family transcriptional regulator [Amycolatopsis sp.]|nr:CopG family transcriptional regulator [Amycolatopsis sp.]
MKTAISVPDDTFDAVTHCAAELGVSRSEFFTMAAKRLMTDIRHTSVTSEINVVLDLVEADDDPAEFAVAAGRAVLAAGDDDW